MPTLVVGTTQCSHNVIQTTPTPVLPQTQPPNPVTNPDKATDSILVRTMTEDSPLRASDPDSNNIGLIAGVVVVALMVITIVTLTTVLGLIIYMRVKNQKSDVPVATNEACGAGLQDTAVYAGEDTYDYPSMDGQTTSSIDTKINEAYATNVEAKPCTAYGISTSAVTNPRVACATDITTERNDAYGIKLQDVAMCGEGDMYTYDYPNMDS